MESQIQTPSILTDTRDNINQYFGGSCCLHLQVGISRFLSNNGYQTTRPHAPKVSNVQLRRRELEIYQLRIVTQAVTAELTWSRALCRQLIWTWRRYRVAQLAFVYEIPTPHSRTPPPNPFRWTNSKAVNMAQDVEGQRPQCHITGGIKERCWGGDSVEMTCPKITVSCSCSCSQYRNSSSLFCTYPLKHSRNNGQL
jgi:hypothetical protein